jgi:hypothetical protein
LAFAEELSVWQLQNGYEIVREKIREDIAAAGSRQQYLAQLFGWTVLISAWLWGMLFNITVLSDLVRACYWFWRVNYF